MTANFVLLACSSKPSLLPVLRQHIWPGVRVATSDLLRDGDQHTELIPVMASYHFISGDDTWEGTFYFVCQSGGHINTLLLVPCALHVL